MEGTMNTITRRLLAGLVLGLVLVAGAGQVHAEQYANSVTLTAASADSTIQYLDRSNRGATTTAGNRREVEEWSVSNTGTVEVQVRIYSKAAPGAWRGGSFPATFGSDYVELTVQPGQAQGLPITLIGYWLEDDPTGGAVTILGWNR
jgi:hypothetical protein